MFKIGDTVWVGEFQQRKDRVPCPVCFTKRYVTLILGDDTEVEVECKFCDVGHFGAQGYVIDGYHYVTTATPKTITGMDIRKDEITYWFGGIGHQEERVAATEEEAVAKAQVDADKYNTNKRELQLERKHTSYKSYTWNAGYFMKKAKGALQDHKHYTEKAKIMESKARPRKENKDAE